MFQVAAAILGSMLMRSVSLLALPWATVSAELVRFPLRRPELTFQEMKQSIRARAAKAALRASKSGGDAADVLHDDQNMCYSGEIQIGSPGQTI